jgi:solute carrier family 35 protein E1
MASDRTIITHPLRTHPLISNIHCSVINKKVLNVLPAPLIVGTVQFGIGALYVLLVWAVGLRPVPTLTKEGKSAVSSVGLWHSFGQLASMISLGAGPVSFTHIVKALEPFFSAVVSGIYFGKWMQPQVYATLIPVVGGVGYACLKERSFSWLAFSAAMASNLAFALRAVLSKVALQSGTDVGSNLTPPNMFGLVTIAAFLMSIPLALVVEGMGFRGLLNTALDSVENTWHFARAVILSGLFHYLNNEVMYLALGSVHPVTLAVGNTMKRVIIMVASVMVFRNQISVQAGIGSGVGISGVLLYSLTKQYYESLEAKQVAAAEKPKKGPFGRVIKTAEKVKATAKVSVSSKKR